MWMQLLTHALNSKQAQLIFISIIFHANQVNSVLANYIYTMSAGHQQTPWNNSGR